MSLNEVRAKKKLDFLALITQLSVGNEGSIGQTGKIGMIRVKKIGIDAFEPVHWWNIQEEEKENEKND